MKIIAILAISICLSACQTPYSGLDPNVVHTPLYRENKVFYLEQIKYDTDGIAFPDSKLIPLYEKIDQADTLLVKNNDPLSIIVDNIALPKEANVNKKYDVAVLLDVSGPDGKNVPLAVWYQRGVQPDQTLNFSNLNVYSIDEWDSLKPPSFRIRVIDVKQEKSQETLALLGKVNNTSANLTAYAANPLITQLLSTGFKAAEYVLSHTSNKLLLDYTVQLYSASIDSQGGSHLGKLRKGSYIAVGRPLNCNKKPCGRSYWNNDLKLSRRTLQLFESTNESKTIFQDAESPFFSMTVVTTNNLVPSTVMERSAAIVEHLTNLSANFSSNEITIKADSLQKSLKAFSIRERLYKDRDKHALDLVFNQINGSELDEENKKFLVRTINRNLHRDIEPLTVTTAWSWWVANKGKCSINEDSLEIACALAGD